MEAPKFWSNWGFPEPVLPKKPRGTFYFWLVLTIGGAVMVAIGLVLRSRSTSLPAGSIEKNRLNGLKRTLPPEAADAVVEKVINAIHTVAAVQAEYWLLDQPV